MLNVYLRHGKLVSGYVIEVSDCGVNTVREDAWMEHERFVVWTSCGFYVCERIQRCAKTPLAFEVLGFNSLCSALRRGTSKFYVPDGGEYVEYDSQKVLSAQRLFNLTDLYSSYGFLVLPSAVREYKSADMAIGDSIVIAVLSQDSLFSCEYVDGPEALDCATGVLAEACRRALFSDGALWTFREHVTREDVYCRVKAVAS